MSIGLIAPDVAFLIFWALFLLLARSAHWRFGFLEGYMSFSVTPLMRSANVIMSAWLFERVSEDLSVLSLGDLAKLSGEVIW